MARTITVEIVGNAADLSRALNQSSAAAGKFEGKAKSALSGVGKTAALAAGGAGVAALTYSLKTGVSEWLEHSKVAAQTAAVLKSTGGAANVTAAHVDALAGALLKKSGVDDETIASGENVLLSFTKIRNEAGLGKDVFDQATKAALNYSVRTGTSMQAAAKLIGRALQDPAKGFAKLARAMGDVSPAVKKQLADALKQNDTFKAQGIVLAQLEKRYGGAYEAMGKTPEGKLNILRESFNNLAGDVVGKFIAKMQEMEPVFEDLRVVFEKVGPSLKLIGGYIVDNILAPFQALAKVLQGDWSGAWDSIKKPIEDLGAVFDSVFGGIAGKISGYITDGAAAAKSFGAGILTGMQEGITGFASWIEGRALDGLAAVTGKLADALGAGKNFGGSLLSGLKNGITGFGEWVLGRAEDAIGFVSSKVVDALLAATSFGSAFLSGLKDGIAGFAAWVRDRAADAVEFIIGKHVAAFNAAKAFGAKILDGLKEGVTGLLDAVIGPIEGALSWLEKHAEAAYNAAWKMGDAIARGIKAGLGPIVAFINGIKAAIDSLTGAFTSNGSVWGRIQDQAGGGKPGGGRGGRGSAFVPASSLIPAAALTSTGASVVMPAQSAQPAPGRGQVVINVPVTVEGALLGTSVDDVADTIRRKFITLYNSNGPLGFYPVT